MRVRPILLTFGLVLMLGGWLASGTGPAPAQTPTPADTATISGYVFHDVDGDGVYDAGEPGLDRLVQLSQGGSIVQEVVSDTKTSAYRFEDVSPGEYLLATELDAGIGFCTDPAFPNFNPLVMGGCESFILIPWHPTTAEAVPLTITGASELPIDIGGQPFDQAVLIGRAILDDDYAAPGTTVSALFAGQECGSTTILPANSLENGFGVPIFKLTILGHGERAGCAGPGMPVSFIVGGKVARETWSYTPLAQQVFPAQFLQSLVAMDNHAWYWVMDTAGNVPPAGSIVQAVIDGTVCGESEIEEQLEAKGIYRLVVPSVAIRPGCGQPGATVSFFLGDARSETTLDWVAGLQRIELAAAIQGTPSPPLEVQPPSPQPTGGPIALPRSGGAQPTDNEIEVMVALVISVGLAYLAMMVRRKGDHR